MPSKPPPKGAKIILDQEVIADAPFVVRRFVKWGEIDFARVAYTGKFLDYILEASETWFKHLTGEHWTAFDIRHDISLPVVGCALDFHIALQPDDRLDLTVRLAHVGRSSHKLEIDGHNQHGELCFESTLSFATIDPESGTSVAMPDDLRARLDAYREACGTK